MKPLSPVLTPLLLSVLVATIGLTCSASAQARAADTLALVTLSDPDPDRDSDADLDEMDDDDLELDADGNFDAAAHVRRQLARQPAARGSGGPPQACMLSGRVTLAGHTEDIRDCMASGGRYSKAEFERACEGLANGLAVTGNAPARIDYLPRCPTPAQGSCRNFMNSGMDAYYYQRTDLTPLPASCAGAGGTWVPGG